MRKICGKFFLGYQLPPDGKTIFNEPKATTLEGLSMGRVKPTNPPTQKRARNPQQSARLIVLRGQQLPKCPMAHQGSMGSPMGGGGVGTPLPTRSGGRTHSPRENLENLGFCGQSKDWVPGQAKLTGRPLIHG